MNRTFLISYEKINEWFTSSKTCLSHGKTISPFRLIHTLSATVARPLTDCRAQIFDIPSPHINDPSWLSSSTSIKSDGYTVDFSRAFLLFNKNNRKRKSHDLCTTIGQWSGDRHFYYFSIECWNCSDRVIYIFFHFIIGYEKNRWVIWLWSSSVIKIVKIK
jgi:hypothetical protein